MSGTYMICDLCGNAGPPAAFLIDHGTRVCYVCVDAQEREREELTDKTHIDSPQNEHTGDPVEKNRNAYPF